MAVGTTTFPTALDTAVELVELTNNASSTLGAAVLVGATTITVDDPGEFPTTGITTLVDDLTTPTKIEVISWTGKSGSDLTGVTKGLQGTSDQAWSIGDNIEIRPTKGHHEALRGAIIAIETKLGYGSSTSTANTVLLGTGVGTSAFGAITNAYIDAAAAIAHSKMAALTVSRLMVTDASGFASVASVTATEAGHLAGVTSAIQTQLNAKQTAFGDQAANVVYGGPATGAAAAPTFRALVAADIPDLSGVYSVAGHTHSYQPLDATLTALAAYATNGLLTQTAADTFTGRTITGTTNVIDVTNGDGVAGNPTLTISATYVGQTSITTLGAIGTGTWNGTAIGAQYGGTGINSSASSGYPSIATGTWSIVSAATLTAALDVLVGDSGAGGTKGLVPAPAAGDAVAGKFLKADGTWTAPSGSGDVVGPASATDNAVARFDTTTGKLIQNSAVTIADTTGNMAGVGTVNTHTIPGGTDTFALLAASQTLTNKTLTTPIIASISNSGTITIPTGTDTLVGRATTDTLTNKTLTAPDINGGTADALTSLGIRSTGTGAFDLTFANTENLIAGRILTFTVNDAARTINLGGDLTLAGAFITSGANSLTLTTSGATNVTLPTSGTLAIVGGTLAQFAATTSAQLAGVISDETGSGALVFGTAPTFASTITVGTAGGTTGAINLLGTTSGTVTLKVADAAGTYTLTLPTTDGDASQFLQTDGAGVLSWATGGGGLTVGTTAIASGAAGRILYEATGNVLGEAAGITYQTGASPTATITAQNATYVGLRINSAATPSANVLEVSADNGTTAHFKVTSTGAPSAPGSGTTSERFGAGSTATNTLATAFGYGATSSSQYTVAIGANAVASGFAAAIAIGGLGPVQATAGNTIAIGSRLTVSGTGTIGINNVPSGSAKTYSGTEAINIGDISTHTFGYGISLGRGFAPTAASQFVAASSFSNGITDVFFGKGVTNATPTAYTINGTGGSGTNIAGADLQLAGGKGTGTGNGGAINFQFARPGGSGTSLNSLTTFLSVGGDADDTTLTQTGASGSTTLVGQLEENVTLSTGGATTDSTIQIPANSFVLSVSYRVTTTIAGVDSTDIQLGDATTATRFRSGASALTSGTTGVGLNQLQGSVATDATGPIATSATAIRITLSGGADNTPTSGAIRITIHYITLTAATA